MEQFVITPTTPIQSCTAHPVQSAPASGSELGKGIDRCSQSRGPAIAHATDVDLNLAQLFRRYAVAAAVGTIGLASLALIGWATGNLALTGSLPHWPSMKPLTALCLILESVSLLLIHRTRSYRAILAAQICAATVATIALAILGELAFGWVLSFDHVYFIKVFINPGMPSPMTAMALAAWGGAILAPGTKHTRFARTPLASVTLFISGVALTGYILGADELYTIARNFSGVSLPTATALFLLSSGLLLGDAERAPGHVMISSRPGGVVLRRVLPTAIVVSLGIEWLAMFARKYGYFETVALSGAVVAIANISILTGGLIWFAIRLNRAAGQLEDQQARRITVSQQIAESSPNAMVMIGPAGRIVMVNAQTENLFGYKRAEMLGQSIELLIPQRFKENHSNLRTAFFKDPESRPMGAGRDLYGLKKDGGEFPIEIGLNPIDTDDGRMVLSAIVDISHRKIAEERLRNTNARLEAVNRELEAFSYSVSHDLRTPLRAVDGFSRILLEDYADKLDSEGQRLLNVVRNGVQKMACLIDDILSFSRMGRSELLSIPIDMEQIVRGILARDITPTVADRNIKIDVKPMPGALGDVAMITQVWVNLLTNAVKFTGGKDAAVIEIGAEASATETTYYVKDNGVGFDMQYVGKLFGVFHRLHGPAEFPGTGIGLAIVKRVITRHGGRVWAEGRLGEGATFYFTLPVAAKAEDVHE